MNDETWWEQMVGNKIWPFIRSDRDTSNIMTKAFVCAWNTNIFIIMWEHMINYNKIWTSRPWGDYSELPVPTCWASEPVLRFIHLSTCHYEFQFVAKIEHKIWTGIHSRLHVILYCYSVVHYAYVKVVINLEHLCFFLKKNHISTTGGFGVGFLSIWYQSPIILRESMSGFNDTSHLGPFLRVSLERWPRFTWLPWKIAGVWQKSNFLLIKSDLH